MELPTHTDLVHLWMSTKYNSVPCIVFFDPLGNGDRISLFKDRLGIVCGTTLGSLVNCDVCILPHHDAISIVNNLDADEWGFVMAWDGTAFVTQNTFRTCLTHVIC